MKPRKSDKYKSKVSPLRWKGKKEKLLARWTDGLFYFVRVTKISEANRTCTVEFEDKSQTSVHFKDLLEEKEEDLVECHCCGKDDSTATNILVQCSNCEREYHQNCHVPAISEEQSADDKFTCRICVFASCAQPGGAKKSGPLAEKYAVMKQHFPYDIKRLTWNATHTCNVEQYFCYCGGPGVWYSKMLQCCRCSQWFHEACLQCLNEELLLGDRFYIFACAHCNQGEEYLQRMDLSWLDIAYISLFHLIMTVGKRYIDVDTDIIPFIMSRAQSFGLKKLLNGLHGNVNALRTELLKVFHKHSARFCCGAEVKKRCTYYGIRERIPPLPPSLQIPAGGEKITAASLASSSGKKTTFYPSKFHVQVPYVLRGANKIIPPTMGAKLRESKLAKIARVKSEHNYCTPLKGPDSSPSRLRSQVSPLGDGVGLGAGNFGHLFDANNNSPSKSSPIKIEPGTSGESDGYGIIASSDTQSSPAAAESKEKFWSLDMAFPEPSNYLGANHPFLTEFEQENLRKQRQHFENQLEHLSSLLMDENEEQKVSCPPIGTPTSTMKDVKGFKGELADLISSTCSSNSSTPKLTKDSPQRDNLTPDKLLDIVTPPPNGVLSRRNRSPSQTRKDSNGSPGSSLLPRCINGVKISPSISKISPKNGLTRVKVEPTSNNSQPEEILDKKSQKCVKALNRCLKNLMPTCGFHFPVLEENHPALAQVGPVINGHPEKSRVGHSLSSSSPAAPQSSPTSRPNARSLSKTMKRGRKRKFDARESLSQIEIEDKSCQNAENVRRSHRSRHCVKRFEASLGCKTYEFLDAVNLPSSELNEAEQYEIISLRTGPGSDLVEYLINWSS